MRKIKINICAKYYLFIFLQGFLWMGSANLFAQSIYPKRSVFGNGGFTQELSLTAKSYYIQHSIGQNGFSGINKSNNMWLLQGFIQPGLVNKHQMSPEKLNIDIVPINNNNVYCIKVGNNENKLITVNLYDILGRKVNTRTIENANEFNIDLNSYSCGYYILSVNTKLKQASAKILKQ